MQSAALLLFYRASAGDPWETLVDEARAAALADSATRAQAAGFERVVVLTPDCARFEALPGVEVRPTVAEAPFGALLRQALDALGPGGFCYAGSGLPLLDVDAWCALRERLARAQASAPLAVAPMAVVNNLYSTDLLALSSAAPLAAFPPDAGDNALGLFLRDRAGLAVETLPRSAAALLDIDTPADVLVLSLCRGVDRLAVGPALAQVLTDAALDTGRLARAADRLTEREAQVLVVGRVGSSVWEALERETAARTRVISEERGLRSRDPRSVRSILGYHLEAVGPAAVAEALAALADAAFVDTRPLFTHLGWQPSRADRFAADALAWEAITHPALRTFTRAVAESRVPVVLGGHTLVSGGLLALIDVAWARWERRKGRDVAFH